jgi:hypothetical protein
MGKESHMEYNPIERIPGALPKGKTRIIKIPMNDNSCISFFPGKENISMKTKRQSPIKKYSNIGSFNLSLTIRPVNAKMKTNGSI